MRIGIKIRSQNEQKQAEASCATALVAAHARRLARRKSGGSYVVLCFLCFLCVFLCLTRVIPGLEISPAWAGVPAKAQETIPSSANASSFFIVFNVNPLPMLSEKI